MSWRLANLPLRGGPTSLSKSGGGPQDDPHPTRLGSQPPPSPSRGGMESATPPRPISASHHSGAMRSGPSAFTTGRVTRRQVKRAGGPSGISASTSKAPAGKEKRRPRRLGSCSGQEDGPAKAPQTFAPAPAYGFLFRKSRRTDSAQAVRQAVDQRLFRRLSVRSWRGRFAPEAAARWRRRQHHQIDAEADVDSRPCPRSAARDAGLAGWRAQARLDHRRGAVGTVDKKLEAPAPRPARASLAQSALAR